MDDRLKKFLWKEFQTAIILSVVLCAAGYLRAVVFFIPLRETLAITSSLFMIVISSILIGTLLPLLMNYVRIDPAHSSTTIQVVMDILGVTITVNVCALILDGLSSAAAATTLSPSVP